MASAVSVSPTHSRNLSLASGNEVVLISLLWLAKLVNA